MRLLTSATRAQSDKQHNATSWAWIYEIMLEESAAASRPFRITSHNEQITIASKTYLPFPVFHEAMQADSQGNLPTFTVSLSNVTRELNRYIEEAKGLSGNRVTIGIFNRGAALPADLTSFDFVVAGCSLSDDLVTLRLQSPDYGFVVPQEIFTRVRCRWRYKGPQCGYVGPLGDCDKSLFGTNGCRVHGDDEVARGLPRLHERRFGGFPGLQRFAV
jgi:phage-related protein